MVEATAVSPEGRISPADSGIWLDAHVQPLARISHFLKQYGALPGIQLAHAGRKASANKPWEGDDHIQTGRGGWDTIAPSPVAFGANLPKVPRAMCCETKLACCKEKAASCEEDDPELWSMTRRFSVALVLTIPVFVLAMLPMLGVPVDRWLGATLHPWLQLLLSTPVVLWGGWPFFERGWRSIVTWNLNMFTLIAIGIGAACFYSRVAVLSPSLIPDSFRHHGAVHVYLAGFGEIGGPGDRSNGRAPTHRPWHAGG